MQELIRMIFPRLIRAIFYFVGLLLVSRSYALDASALLQEADRSYSLRENREQLMNSIRAYEELLEQIPEHYEAAWKLSRAYWFLGYHTPREEQKVFFQKGIEIAKRATELNEEGCEGFFWMGVNYALLADTAGALKALSLVDDMKNLLERAMDLNPNCECGGPQRVLGRVYSRIPWFKGGSKSRAIEYLIQSLEQCPQDTQSRIFLAEIYLDQGKTTLAEEQLKLVLEMAPLPDWMPETRENKELAEKMLTEIRKEESARGKN